MMTPTLVNTTVNLTFTVNPDKDGLIEYPQVEIATIKHSCKLSSENMWSPLIYLNIHSHIKMNTLMWQFIFW